MRVELVVAALVAAAVAVVLPGAVTLPGSVPPAGRGSGWRAVSTVVATRLRAVRRARSAARVRAQCLVLLEAFAAELRAGRPAGTALVRAASGGPQPVGEEAAGQMLLGHVLGAIRLGGDIPDALIRDSEASGAPVLRRLSACWRVGEGTGAGLAASVTRLASSTRESERVRWELAARTAEPRATMRVLAALPAFGLLLGAGLGADTVGWLVGTPQGRVVLAAGLALDLLGVLWSRRLVAAVEAAL